MTHYTNKTKKKGKNIKSKKNKTRKSIKKRQPIDFYNSTNKHWVEHHRHIPKSRNETNPFILLQNKVNTQIKNIIVKKIYRDNKTMQAARIKNIYQACLKTTDSQIETHISSSISTLQYLRQQENMYALFAWFIQSGFTSLFNWSVEIDEKEPTQYVSYIRENGLSLPSKSLYEGNNKESKERKEQYLQFLQHLFHVAFGKNHSYNIEKIWDIEKEVAHRLYDDDKVRNFDLLYNTFNKTTLKKECHFDWEQFSQSLDKNNNNNANIIVENPKYIKTLMTLLEKNWASEDWNNYWVCQILLTASKFHTQLYELNCRFFAKPNHSYPSLNSRAIMMVEKIMNTEINKKYLEYYKNTREIAFTETLFVKLKHIFKERIRSNTWLSSSTIKKAIDKINQLTPIIGCKSEWQPDPECEFVNDDSFDNYQKYMEWSLDQNIEKLNKKKVPSIHVWLRCADQNTFDVNAFYSNNKNEIIIPNAILQPPFINMEKSMAYNYANMGTILAHEMIHALDNDGCHYDERGYRRIWFKTDEIKVYQEKQNDIMKYYEDAAKKDGEMVRPNITIGENIADIGGLLIAEQAYIDYLNKENIYDDFRMKDFYRLYAEKWKTIMKPKWLHQLYQYDIHSLAKYRVNCVLSFSELFNKLFDIQGESLKQESPW